MKRLLVASAALLLTTSCTILNPLNNAPQNIVDNCDTVDCVIDTVNEFEGTCNRFDFMEGYNRPDLRVMEEMGRLEIEPLSAGWVLAGVFGYANIHEGKYGNIYSCTAHYTNLKALAHELMHCLGCTDRSDLPDPMMYAYRNTYSPDQNVIMEKEGVSHWTDTNYYKNEETSQHLPLGILHP